MIETERLILREWRNEDLEPFAAMNADERVMEFFQAPLTFDESALFLDRIKAHHDKYGFTFFAVERKDTEQMIGMTGLAHVQFEADFCPTVEIGWRLAADHWGQGFASEAATGALNYGFDQFGLAEIVSFTAVINKRSARVMEKIGMVHDTAGDFDHPNVPVGHRLERHVLYRMGNPSN